MKISITGTPGTGKTTLSKKLAKKLGYRLIDLNKVIKKEKLYSGYDKKMKSYIVSVPKLQKHFKKIHDNTVIDSHLSHFLPSNLVIVLRCKPEILRNRLKKKKWSKQKIQENVEAEFINIISEEARKMHRNVLDIDTTGLSESKTIQKIVKSIKKKKNKKIDWTTIKNSFKYFE
jgi:adenylate kinase